LPSSPHFQIRGGFKNEGEDEDDGSESSLEVPTHRTNIHAVVTTAIKPPIKPAHWSLWLGMFGLALLFAGLRWNNLAAPLIRDEGEYAYSAQLLVQGVAPYEHAFMQKPPGVIYSYALSNLLLPGVFWAPRLLAAVCIGLATVLLGYIARWEFGEGVALPAMWLATPMILLPGRDQFTANVEMFMLLPLLATVAVYCYSRRQAPKNSHWLAAGFLAATTLLFKYTALPVLAFIFAAWLVESWLKGASAASLFRLLASAVGGGILALALGLAYFLMHDGGRTFWECTVVFNRYYAASDNFTWGYFWSKGKEFWDNWWILFLVPWAALWQPRARLAFWVGAFLCAVVTTNGSCYGQYYVPLMPFWALLNAVGIRALATRLSRWMPKLTGWAGGLVTFVVVLLTIRPDVPWMRASSEQFITRKMAESPFIEAQAAARQVARMTSPSDFVFVAGSEPEILAYAQRFSPTRFITSYALMIPTPLAAGYQHEAMHDLLSRPPKVIVFVQSGSSWMRQPASPPQFLDFMGRFLNNYNLVGGYVKVNPLTCVWTGNLSAEEYKEASLILYLRKPDAK
jgi:hypothetical protein